MKTLQELYSEVLKSEELKQALAEAVRNQTVEAFLTAHGCEAGAEELTAFLKEQQSKTGELGDDELENVSGGCDGVEALESVISMGVGCAILAIRSAFHPTEGPKDPKDGSLLC